MTAHFPTLFLTGTGTGVGKTFVTALLALKLRQMGVDCGVMKPFATGAIRKNGILVSEDAIFLREATGICDPPELINPICLEEPLAPLVAARRAGISTHLWLSQVGEAWHELQKRHECVLIEGVGGILVPICEENGRILTCADWLERWELPAIIVARRTLGTINHTLLTARVPLKLPARFIGLIFNDPEVVETGDLAALGSPQMVAQMSGLPIWGEIGWQKQHTAANLEELAAALTFG